MSSSTADATDAVDRSFDEWIATGSTHLNRLAAAQPQSIHPTALVANVQYRIDTLRRLTAQYRVIRNVHSAQLLALPRELVDHIILLVAAEQHVKKWMKLGQVCSTLRTALLGLHSLWGAAICTWDAHQTELLERAGPTIPLDLVVVTEAAEEFAKAHLSRARSIRSSCVSFVEWFLYEEATLHLPLLENVDLKVDVGALKSDSAADQPRKNTPLLKRVVLENLQWSFSPHTLTELHLKFYTWMSTHWRYPPEQFIDTLRHCANLHTLRIEDCIPHLSDEVTRDDKIHLAALSRLDIIDERVHVLQLWDLLSVPSETRVSLTLDCRSTGPDCFDEAVLFRPHLRGRHVTALSVGTHNSDLHTSNYRDRLAVTVNTIPRQWSEPDDVALGPVFETTTLTLEYVYYFHGITNDASVIPIPCQDALLRVCDALGVQSVTRFVWQPAQNTNCYQDISYKEQRWADLLRHFSSLETLEVRSMTVQQCTALGPLKTSDVDSDDDAHSSTRSSAGSPTESLAPRLHQLILRDTQIVPSGTGRHKPKSYEVTVDGLMRMMKVRAAHGSPLASLRLDGLTVKSLQRYAGSRGRGDKYFSGAISSRFPGMCLEMDPVTH